MKKQQIETGDRVKCKVTEIEGVVVVRHDYLYGVARIGIQPSGSHEGKPHEALHIDMPQAELIKKNVVKKDGMIPEAKVMLGDRCRDIISGFEGICTGSAEWLYACTKVMITPEKVEGEKYKPSEAQWFDEPQMKAIKEKVIKEDSHSTGGFGKSVCPKPSASR